MEEIRVDLGGVNGAKTPQEKISEKSYEAEPESNSAMKEGRKLLYH